MGEQPEITDADVQDLLRQAQAHGEQAREFAAIHLESFRTACVQALVWQRTEGRALVLAGVEPDEVRRQTEARVAEARRTLHRKLVSLLEWEEGKAGRPPS